MKFWQGSLFLALLLASASPSEAWDCIRTRRGDAASPCVRWRSSPVVVRSFLGSPPRTLANGTRTWDDNAVLAAEEWSGLGGPVRISLEIGGTFRSPCGAQGPRHACDNTGPAGDNPILFANDFCGRDFGDIIQLTNNCFRPDTGEMIAAPVFINAGVLWNAYDGPVRFDLSTGTPVPVYDIRRVLLHELGHVLGLAHPDEAVPPQQVTAIMNSRVSGIDRLQPDDINGYFSIYGSGPPGPAPSPSQGCMLVAPAGQLPAPLWILLFLAGLRLSRSAGMKKTGATGKVQSQGRSACRSL